MISLCKTVHLLFRMIGYDFLRYTEENFVSLRQAHILHNLRIDVVLDIGANEGTYALGLREAGYKGHIISFEPLSQAFKKLKEKAKNDSLWKCENVAVGEFDGEATINISGRQTSSSLLPMTEHHIQAMPSSNYIATEKVKILKLDSLMHNILIPEDQVYLKADVQGYEMNVLQGATQTLMQTAAIEVELSLTQMYEKSPLYNEMINYLEGLGFGLVSFEPVFTDPHTGYVLQADGIFSRRA